MFGNEFIHANHTFVNLQIVLILWKTGQMVYNSSHKWLLIYLSTNSNNDAILLYSNQMNHLFNTSYFLLSVLFFFLICNIKICNFLHCSSYLCSLIIYWHVWTLFYETSYALFTMRSHIFLLTNGISIGFLKKTFRRFSSRSIISHSLRFQRTRISVQRGDYVNGSCHLTHIKLFYNTVSALLIFKLFG